MKRLICLLMVVCLLALSACTVNMQTELGDGDAVDVDQLKENIASQQKAESEARLPKTYTSYDGTYTVTVEPKWRFEEQGTLNKSKSTMFELTGVIAGSNLMFGQLLRREDTTVAKVMKEHMADLGVTHTQEKHGDITYIRYVWAPKGYTQKRVYYVFFIPDGNDILEFDFFCAAEYESIHSEGFFEVVDSLSKVNKAKK